MRLFVVYKLSQSVLKKVLVVTNCKLRGETMLNGS